MKVVFSGLGYSRDTSDEDGGYPPRLSFYYCSNMFLSILCGVTSVAMIHVSIKVRAKLWDTEKIIPSMLAFLVLALISRYCFFSLIISFQVVFVISHGQCFDLTVSRLIRIRFHRMSNARCL